MTALPGFFWVLLTVLLMLLSGLGVWYLLPAQRARRARARRIKAQREAFEALALAVTDMGAAMANLVTPSFMQATEALNELAKVIQSPPTPVPHDPRVPIVPASRTRVSVPPPVPARPYSRRVRAD